jgi:hypothetical protein
MPIAPHAHRMLPSERVVRYESERIHANYMSVVPEQSQSQPQREPVPVPERMRARVCVCVCVGVQ